jgi:Flp pilus assembly protein TadB
VAKLTLYLGAGLTVRSAFQRMAGEYEAEIGFVCRQLQAGISEATAYEQLGKRTGVQEYIRLSTLLTQNLKKGNGDLLKRLREETKRAENEKIQTCKKLAEEASTKLLVPMVLFLVVVMVMVMLPAFLSVEM